MSVRENGNPQVSKTLRTQFDSEDLRHFRFVMEDIEATAWKNAHPDDLWVFDKLILARKLGYVCGPAGVDVPKPDWYIVRPCVNIPGMGRGAHFLFINNTTTNLPYGYFWCEIFTGRHISVDYYFGSQLLAVEGIRYSPEFRTTSDLWRFQEWRKVPDQIDLPYVIRRSLVIDRYPYINVEYVDGHPIEVHFRANPDFKYGNSVAIPVWEGQTINVPEGMRFVEDSEYKRIGFYIDNDHS